VAATATTHPEDLDLDPDPDPEEEPPSTGETGVLCLEELIAIISNFLKGGV
jgi:hypothetical protein